MEEKIARDFEDRIKIIAIQEIPYEVRGSLKWYSEDEFLDDVVKVVLRCVKEIPEVKSADSSQS